MADLNKNQRITELLSEAIAQAKKDTGSPRFSIDPAYTASVRDLLTETYRQELRYGIHKDDTLAPGTESKIASVARWLCGRNLKPGLLLCGGMGNGKTTMLNAIRELFALMDNVGLFGVPKPYISWAPTLVNMAMSTDPEAAAAYVKIVNGQVVLLDDLGCEPAKVKVYGTDTTPIVDFLCARYQNPEYLTAISTNLTMAQIKEVYGPRVEDRLKEMCEIIVYTEKSFRK